MARPQEIDFIPDASNDRAALAVNILLFTECALLVKSEGTEITELRMNGKIRGLAVRKGTNLLERDTEVNACPR
jgi:hypothetical protein